MTTPTPGVRCLFLVALVGVAASACASGGVAHQRRQELEEQIRSRGIDPGSVVVPYETSEEMRTWVHAAVSDVGSSIDRLQALLEKLFGRDRAPLTYERGHTATAREVWQDGVANCLSFTHLFVGLARELDLDVFYLRVSDLQSFEKDGDLVVASEHVTAAYGAAAGLRILDFSDRAGYDYHQTRRISDLTAIALYYSNLGANRIRQGASEEALGLLEMSIRLDPELADGWINYGVALRRAGRMPEAEAAFRRALEVDPGMISAYNNLASLLERTGRGEEGRRLLELTDRRANRNPFSYLALGDLSMREGHLEEAGRYFRRAQRLDPGSAEALAALGQWALASGHRRDAERWLRKARKADPEAPRVVELVRSLRISSLEG